MKQVLSSDAVASLLAEDAVMTIAVSGTDTEQSARVLSDMESCTAGNRSTYCYSAATEDVNAARELGLPYAKYRVLLEIQALDPSITAEDIREMSMREIQALLESLSGEEESAPGGNAGNGQHGAGNGWGKGGGAGPKGQGSDPR